MDLEVGANPYFLDALDETPVLVVRGAIRLCYRNISAPAGAAWVWINLYSAAAAADVTPGTTDPVQSWPIPVNGILDDDITNQLIFGLGLVINATSTPGGASAPDADAVVNLSYKSDGYFVQG